MPYHPQLEYAEARDRSRRVADFVLALEPEQIMLVWYRFFCGLDKAETARLLGVGRDAESKLEARALRDMRQSDDVKRLKDYC